MDSSTYAFPFPLSFPLGSSIVELIVVAEEGVVVAVDIHVVVVAAGRHGGGGGKKPTAIRISVAEVHVHRGPQRPTVTYHPPSHGTTVIALPLPGTYR